MLKLSKSIYVVPDGKIYPEWFHEGDVVTGGVAEAARAQDALAKPKKATKATKAPENK